MRKSRGVSEYTTLTLYVHDVHFPKGDEVCRHCPFCVADPSNHKREVCMLTNTILPYADISMEGNCPLKAKEVDTSTPGERIRMARFHLRLTLQELGARVGVSKQSVACWEKGTRDINMKHLSALAEALNTTPEYIIYGTETAREEKG